MDSWKRYFSYKVNSTEGGRESALEHKKWSCCTVDVCNIFTWSMVQRLLISLGHWMVLLYVLLLGGVWIP